MRIVSGIYKGQSISAPKDSHIRPTTDRIRESVFNILEHGIEGFSLEGARAIDLFAGTGALGLEAISRGARFSLFVEEAASARGLIRENIEKFGAGGKTRIFRRDATQLGEVGTMQEFDLAFLDPPYGKGLGEKALNALHGGGWLAENALIVWEEEKKTELQLPQEFHRLDQRIYGNIQIVIARYST